MKDEYVMGIDNGGTVTKAAIYDRKGQVLAIASKSTQMLTPREFHTERSIDELWAANVEVIKKAIEQSGIDASQIKGVAVTGHGNGLYLVDEEGHPVRNGIISTDSRAKDTLRDGNAHQNSLPTFCQKRCSPSGPDNLSPCWHG